MKKVFAVLAFVGMFSFVACGPKAEEAATEATESVENAATEATDAAAETATEVVAAADSTMGAVADSAAEMVK